MNPGLEPMTASADAIRAPSLRLASVRAPVDSTLEALRDRHQRGQSVDVIAFWRDHDPTGNLFLLSDLIKADIRWRFSIGETPTAADYLEACDLLRADKDRVVSLAYEEYCLLIERSRTGDQPAPSPDSFCDRYPTWRDSLRSQLDYHRVISQMIGPTATPARWPSVGAMVDGCRLEAPLGKGGAASVFRAAEEALGHRPVVLKLTTDEGDEEDVLGKLKHRHIVGIFWARPRDPETGLRTICMPYQQGTTLDQVLANLPRPGERRSALDLWTALKASIADGDRLPSRPAWPDFPVRGTFADAIAWLAWKLADALAHAHDLKIIHRDLKPANILLTVDDGPQLLDFNLAKNPNAPERAESAMRGGTLPYMAPEQLEAFLDARFWAVVGPRSDLFSLALVARELLTGLPQDNPGARLPRARAVAEMLDLRKRPPAPIEHDADDIPGALAAILTQCAAPRPIDRYPDARTLADDLGRYLHRLPLKIAHNRSIRERLANRLHRGRFVLAGSAAVLSLIGLITIGPWIWTELNPPPSVSLLGQTLRPYLGVIGQNPNRGEADPAAIQRAIEALDRVCPDGDRPAAWMNARSILECLAGGSGPIDPGNLIDESNPPTDPVLASWFHNHGKSHLAQPSVSRADADEAIAAFRLSALFEPRQPRHWIGLASACLPAGRLAEGIQYATRGLETAQESPVETHRARGSAMALKFRGLLTYQRALDPAAVHDRPARLDQALRDIELADWFAEPSPAVPPATSRVLRRELAMIRGRIQMLRIDQAEREADSLAAFVRAIDAATAYGRVESLRREELGLPPTGTEADPILTPLYLDRRQAHARLSDLLETCREAASETVLADGISAVETAERILAAHHP